MKIMNNEIMKKYENNENEINDNDVMNNDNEWKWYDERN